MPSPIYLLAVCWVTLVCLLMLPPPPKSTRTYTLCPYTTLFRADDVFILGVGTSPVGVQPESGFTDLVAEAVRNVLSDAQVDPKMLTQVWFSNYTMDFWGQRACRGQEVLTPLAVEGLIPAGLPIVNVEGGCASGPLAFHEAWKHIMAGIDRTEAHTS